MQYQSTGLFWYGNDDWGFIQAAINVAANPPVTNTPPYIPPGLDIYLPANAACGITKTVVLPPESVAPNTPTSGTNSLRGYGSNSSRLVALGPAFTQDSNHSSYAMLRDYDPKGENGGGARELYVEGNLLVTDTCGTQGGQNQIYEGVACFDGTHSEWLCGGDTAIAQMTDILFLRIQGISNYNAFPATGMRSTYNWYAGKYCNWSSIVNSKFHSATIGIEDAENDWNVYSGDNVTGSQPFNVEYCAEIQGRQHITNLDCNDPVVAAVHVKYVSGVSNTNVNADIQGVNIQWIDSLPVVSGVSACGVAIDSGEDYVYASGLQAFSQHETFLGSNFVCQSGGVLGSHDVITNNPGSTIAVAGAATSLVMPQGRLTLTSGTPVMTSNTTSATTVYYAPFAGGSIPIFNGVSTQNYQFTGSPSDSTGLGLTLDSNTSETGYQAKGNLYDLFLGFSTLLPNGTPVLCTGPAWTSATSRGAGTAISRQQGIWANQNVMNCRYGTDAACLSGATPCYFACPQAECTYVGTMYATANGQTAFDPQPAPNPGGPGPSTGPIAGTNAGVFFQNAYNLVPVVIEEQDNNTAWTCVTQNVWEPADAGASGGGLNNEILVVDDTGAVPWNVTATQQLVSTSTRNPQIGVNIGSTSANPGNGSQNLNTNAVTVPYQKSGLPLLGENYAQGMEKVAGSGACPAGVFLPNFSMQMSSQY